MNLSSSELDEANLENEHWQQVATNASQIQVEDYKVVPTEQYMDYNGETFVVQYSKSLDFEQSLASEPIALCGSKKKRIPSAIEDGLHSLSKKSKEDHRFIEPVSAYRCKLCSSLMLTFSEAEEHLANSHEDEFMACDDWLEVAQRENIRLECPRCENSFASEGSRSFKAHVMDDHQVSEEVAKAMFERQSITRQCKAMEILREQRLSVKIKRSAVCNKKLQAYVNNKGELRVKSLKRETQGEGSDEEFDVAADKYFKTAKEYGDAKAANEDESSTKKRCNTREIAIRDSKMGRRKGSKSIGISKLKQINPNISMSDEIMGSLCNRGRCGVRLLDPEKLRYHRERCHEAGANDYICPECLKTGVKFSGLWSKVSMHLWRVHQIDMELIRCSKCPDFRAFNRARYEDHLSKHKSDRPHQCDQCDKAFKSQRYLKDHLVRGHGKPRIFECDDQIKKYNCPNCTRLFKTQTSLCNHIKSVHEGFKPYACRYCDYSTANKGNLVIHERVHTGEKPYACEYCKYRCADRNCLKKHLLRHSGVNRFFCKLCDFGTIQAVNLGYHYNASHFDQALKQGLLFKCSHCKYYTINQKSYNSHLSKSHDSPTALILP